MKKIIILTMFFSLMACAETWQGVKKDSKAIAKSVGEAANELGDAIGETLNSDEDKDKKGEK